MSARLGLGKLKSAWRLPLHEKLWFVFFYPYSGMVRLVILTLPFRYLSGYLGLHYQNYELSPLVTEQQLLRAWRIGRLAELVAKYTPWQSKCLVQAIMVRTLLGWYDIPYIMYFGVQLTGQQDEPMKAHAWVKVGSRIVSGASGHKQFAIVSSYIAPSILAESVNRQ